MDIKGYQSRIESFFGKPVVTKKKETPKSAMGKGNAKIPAKKIKTNKK